MEKLKSYIEFCSNDETENGMELKAFINKVENSGDTIEGVLSNIGHFAYHELCDHIWRILSEYEKDILLYITFSKRYFPEVISSKVDGIAKMIYEIEKEKEFSVEYVIYDMENKGLLISLEEKSYVVTEPLQKYLEGRLYYAENIVSQFVKYVVDETAFDRDDPDKGKKYIEGAEYLLDDIENNRIGAQNSNYLKWQLAVAITGVIEDNGALEEDEKLNDENLSLMEEYLFKALNLYKESIAEGKGLGGYGDSSELASNFNYIGYTLVQLDRLRKKYYNEMPQYKDEAREFLNLGLRNVQSDRLEALLWSNLGAWEDTYGSIFSAIDYDIKALKLKEKVVEKESREMLYVASDALLTTIKSHMNIAGKCKIAINNLLDEPAKVKISSDDKEQYLEKKSLDEKRIEYYFKLGTEHAVKAIELRQRIKNQDSFPQLEICKKRLKWLELTKQDKRFQKMKKSKALITYLESLKILYLN